jgi:hypothetical protein
VRLAAAARCDERLAHDPSPEVDDMTGFIQIIEFQTTRFDEVKALGDQFRQQRMASGDGAVPRRAYFTADRDRQGHYVNIVEFDSYEAAMENSSRPETSEFAAKMAELCDGAPRFYNLDITETWDPSTT